MIQPDLWTVVVWMLLSALLAVFWVAFVGGSALISRRYKCPLPIAMAIAWCGLEWTRKNYFLGGFPFAALEHSQHSSVLLIQVADISGEYTLAAVMFLSGGCLVEGGCGTA